MTIYRERDKQLEIAFTQMHALDVMENFQVPDEYGEEIELEDLMSDEDFKQGQNAINVAQRELFIKITQTIRQQIMGEEFERLKLFITGGAGTGKTFLLRLLKTQISKCYGK